MSRMRRARSRNAERAGNEGNNDGGVEAREQTETKEKKSEPGHQHGEDEPGQRARSLFAQEASRLSDAAQKLQRAALAKPFEIRGG